MRAQPIQTSAVVVVIPIHNALSQTARCLESVSRFSPPGTQVLLVDDASDAVTKSYLRAFVQGDPRFVLTEQPENRGFLHAANRGMSLAIEREGTELVVLLNSDTVVTRGWIDAFIRCFESDETIGLATTLSNNAVNLSLCVPEGLNIYEFAEHVREVGAGLGYPDVTTAIGFCMGIRSSALRDVGGFDEVFAPGYAEDSDYHFRIVASGYRSVLVSDCFIYHESRGTFSERAHALIAKNRPVFDRRWGVILKQELRRHESLRTLDRFSEALARSGSSHRCHDVLFILPTAKLCGGVIVVYELVNRLVELGMNVAVAVVSEKEEVDMPLLFSPYFIPPNSWMEAGRVPKAKVYVATYFETVPYVAIARAAHENARAAYLVQGYEGWFPEADLDTVVATYGVIANRIVVSRWLQTMLKRWGYSSTHIPNGVDTKFFVPRPQGSPENGARKPFTLFTMLRRDPQGGWRLALQVLRRLRAECKALRVIAVGDLVSDPEYAPYLDEGYRVVSRSEMLRLYQRADAFLDCAMVQGFGLMGLEAMSCGVPVVLTKSGGVLDYADESSAILVDIGDEDGAFRALLRLSEDKRLREELSRAGRERAVCFDWEHQVAEYAEYFRKLLMDSEGEEDLSSAALNRLLLRDFVHVRALRANIHQAELKMVEELSRSRPRGVEPLFAEREAEFTDMFRLTREGASLAAVYENGRLAIAREAKIDPEFVGTGRIFDRLRSLVPPSA